MNSSSSRKSSPTPKREKEWKSQIYFDPESDKSCGTTYSITNDQLRTKMTALVDPGEKILEVFLCKVPLSECQWTNLILCHQFVVFHTASHWWSIEKNSEGLTVQRSKEKDAVMKQYQQKPRILGTYWYVELIQEDEGRITMGDFINWLWAANHLHRKYHFLQSNCQYFAQSVYDEIIQHYQRLAKYLRNWAEAFRKAKFFAGY